MEGRGIRGGDVEGADGLVEEELSHEVYREARDDVLPVDGDAFFETRGDVVETCSTYLCRSSQFIVGCARTGEREK